MHIIFPQPYFHHTTISNVDSLKDLKIDDKIEWPKIEGKYLQEKFVNIVVQINGKKISH